MASLYKIITAIFSRYLLSQLKIVPTNQDFHKFFCNKKLIHLKSHLYTEFDEELVLIRDLKLVYLIRTSINFLILNNAFEKTSKREVMYFSIVSLKKIVKAIFSLIKLQIDSHCNENSMYSRI